MIVRRVCVFCGSSPGANEKYVLAARELGRILAAEKIALVYGGGNIGLMGTISNTVMENGGRVIGVIPDALTRRELANRDITRLHVVKTMHERKEMMARLSDAFIAMPGGMGTLEEFSEIVTWAQLGIHCKPCGLLNIEGYYDRLVEFLDHAVKEQFIRPQHRSLILLEKKPLALIRRLQRYAPPKDALKWID